MDQQEYKGLIVSIYRRGSGDDCSNNGISSRYTQAVAISPLIPGIFTAPPNMPVIRLVEGVVPGTVQAVPLEVGERWSMFGGAFVYSCDSRWHEAVETICESPQSGAVPLHDRVE